MVISLQFLYPRPKVGYRGCRDDHVAFLQNLASSLLLLGDSHYRRLAVSGGVVVGLTRRLLVSAVVSYNGEDGALKDLVHAAHLLAAALHVLSSHFLCDGHSLLRGDGCETLCLEHVDTCSLVAQIRLEANEDERGVGAKMEDFGVPLLLWLVKLAVCHKQWSQAETYLVQNVL